jgi:cyanate permease
LYGWLVLLPGLPEETHGLGTFLFPRPHRLRMPMKNSSRAFYFIATLCLLLALAGAFMTGYYSGRNASLVKLGRGLGVGGALSLIFASAVHKKRQPEQSALRRHV